MQIDTNDLRKKALTDQLGGDLAAFGAPPSAPSAPLPGPAAPQSPPYQIEPGPASPASSPAPAADYGRLMGYDAGKLNDPNKHDFKYDTARVLSRFDPRGGFSSDVINALNSELGNTYGTFSGAGDKLSLSGAKGAKDAADFANQDWIFAHKANSDATKWNFGGGGAAPETQAELPQGGGMGIQPFGGIPLDGALDGDPLAKIQQAISQLSGSRPNFDALLAQLGGAQ